MQQLYFFLIGYTRLSYINILHSKHKATYIILLSFWPPTCSTLEHHPHKYWIQHYVFSYMRYFCILGLVHPNLDIANKSVRPFLFTISNDSLYHIKCNMLSKFSKWELGFVHYIAKFSILRFTISRFEYTLYFTIRCGRSAIWIVDEWMKRAQFYASTIVNTQINV